MPQVSEIFAVRNGNSLELDQMVHATSPKGVNFVARSGTNNGVTGRVLVPDGVVPGAAGEITVALSGNSVLSSFVQPEAFITGFHVAVLSPLSEMSLGEKLWWCRCIFANQFRFSFGRQANRTLRGLQLPDHIAKWATVSAALDFPGLDAPASKAPRPFLDTSSWTKHNWGDLFDVQRGKYIPTVLKSQGDTPCVSSSAKNNGWSRFVNLAPNFPGGSISVARNGSVGEAFYQPLPYFATDDVHVLTASGWELNPGRGLFLASVIRRERYRYNYGRKWSVDGMRRSAIALPTDSGGVVDWKWIDRYVASSSWTSSFIGAGRQ